MTDRELMQQALEALEGLADTSWTAAFKQRKYDSDEPKENVQREFVLGAITALRERLAQPQQVERVECTRCGRILADVPPEPVVPDNFAARWRNLVSAVRELHGPS